MDIYCLFAQQFATPKYKLQFKGPIGQFSRIFYKFLHCWMGLISQYGYGYCRQLGQLLIQQILMKVLCPITPPTQKSLLIRRILICLTVLTFLQGMFLVFTYGYKTVTHFLSFVTYIFTIRSLSYFGCIVNQFISITAIWWLLIQMAIQLKIGLYQMYLSSQGIFKMSSLIFEVVGLYFNYIAYKEFKNIAYEVYMQENWSERVDDRPDRDRDRRDRRSSGDARDNIERDRQLNWGWIDRDRSSFDRDRDRERIGFDRNWNNRNRQWQRDRQIQRQRQRQRNERQWSNRFQ